MRINDTFYMGFWGNNNKRNSKPPVVAVGYIPTEADKHSGITRPPKLTSIWGKDIGKKLDIIG